MSSSSSSSSRRQSNHMGLGSPHLDLPYTQQPTNLQSTPRFPSPALPPSDVETTNWNAVKMLASKYGITLRNTADEYNSSPPDRDAHASHSPNPDSAPLESQDLGVGTPFSITATRLEGGRFIYRFKWRGSASPQPSDRPAPSTDFGPLLDPAASTASSTFPRSSSSGAVASTNESSATEGSSSLFRKSGNLMLKSSRSIPVLRGNRSTAYGRSLLPATQVPTAASSANPDRGLLWNPLAPPVNTAGPSLLQVPPASVSMARAESTPVSGLYAPRNWWTGRLEEGDVLGAILGLRQEELWVSAASQPSRHTGSDQQPSSSQSVTASPNVAARSSETISNTLGTNAQAADLSAHGSQSSDSRNNFKVSPFGSDVLLKSDWSSEHHTPTLSNPREGLQPPSKRRQVNFVEHPTSLGGHILPELDFGNKFAKSPRLHQLREQPSFASTASDSTARAPADDEDDQAKFPPELVPHLSSRRQDGTFPDTFIFDVLQHYRHPSSRERSQSCSSLDNQTRAEGKSFSAHRRLQSAELIKSAASGQSSSDAHKNLIAEAQALPTSAAPGDDPRFAIWAVRSETDSGTFILSGRDGETKDRASIRLDPSARNSVQPTSGKRRSVKTGSGPSKGSDTPSSEGSSRQSLGLGKSSSSKAASSATEQRDSVLFPPGKPVMLAATPARLVAEITSEIDQRLLTDFFYTFREFLDSLELLRLLTLRFDWALQEASSAQDEARRRIVRVRTYVVIKHWLLQHFEFDFLPNRELRQSLAGWLNTIAKDQRVVSRPADQSIIKSLRKVVRGLKDTYSQTGVGGLLFYDAGRQPGDGGTGHAKNSSYGGSSSSSRRRHGSLRLDELTQAEGSRDSVTCQTSPVVGDDIDLDFVGDDGSSAEGGKSSSSALALGSMGLSVPGGADSAGAVRKAAIKAAAESVVLSPTRQPGMRAKPAPSVVPSPNLGMQTSSPPPLPHAHNALSRVFVHTVGRLSRFKRVLGSRSTLLPQVASDPHNEDLEFEANDSGDLLFIRGGLENFIHYFNLGNNANAAPEIVLGDGRGEALSQTDEEDERVAQVSDTTAQDETPSMSTASVDRSTPASSIDLVRPTSVGDVSADSKAQTGLGIQGMTDDLTPDMEDLAETAQPTTNDPLGLELGALHSLSPTKQPNRGPEHLHHTTSDQTLRSFSRTDDSIAVTSAAADLIRRSSSRNSRPMPPLGGTRISVRSSHFSGPRIVQIDDIDLSSDEDDGAVRRALRRLPGARDLRMANNVRDLEPVRQSMDSMSSFAFGRPPTSTLFGRPMSADSFSAVGLQPPSPPAPPVIGTVQSEMFDPDEALQGYELVKGFQLDGLDSDDDEPGDVEAALRRLEGIIDEDKQREKARRVEAMWEKSQERNKVGSDAGNRNTHHSDPASMHPADKQRASTSSRVSFASRAEVNSILGGDVADNEEDLSGPMSIDRKDRTLSSHASFLDLADDDESEGHTSQRTSRSSRLDYDAQRSPAPSERRLAKLESTPVADKMQLEQEQQRRPESEPRPVPAGVAASSAKLAQATGSGDPAAGRAAGAKWMSPRRETETGGFARAIPAARTAKAGMWNFPPVHRSFLLSYRSEVITRQMCLIEAELLQAVSWDELAGSRWKERRFPTEVTNWETFYRERVRDRLSAQRQNVAHRECAVEAIVARFNLTSNWVASEVVLTQNLDERVAVVSKLIRVAWKCYLASNFASLAQIIFGLSTPWVERLRRTWSRIGYYEMRIWRDLNSFVGPRNNFKYLRNAMVMAPQGEGAGCIPFFGLFLSDLIVNDALPAFLDGETSPWSGSGSGSGLGLEPLPHGVQTQPLVNVYKFRVVAATIASVLAFQERSRAYAFEADASVYVKCLKIRCLQGEQLAQISHAAEP